ncbi:hypothetical protein BCR44DRAFT_1481950 [Catenaria anguillulae PL171]|uniref:USP domain-containing protein n=1 Tax=Catenaria anguillulae PL171 TaxID=765915 RepID=A0A1Y2I274_9FUNG|nr:hypothetical protein BCR44DRAFT_1481950 [Catenaria anguillulae PL171]
MVSAGLFNTSGLPTKLNEQEDAEEFLGRLIDFLKEESVAWPKTHYTKREHVLVFRCGGTERGANKVLRIAPLPTYLVARINPFSSVQGSLVDSKVGKRFTFPAAIDMRPYLACKMHKAAPGSANDLRVLYDLVVAVVHVDSARSGHYFSLLRDECSGKWLKFGDTVVSPFGLAHLPAEANGSDGSTKPTCSSSPVALPMSPTTAARLQGPRPVRRPPHNRNPRRCARLDQTPRHSVSDSSAHVRAIFWSHSHQPGKWRCKQLEPH